MFSPPYLHYPESSSNHFSLKRPGIADAKNLFFFEGQGQEQFLDENGLGGISIKKVLYAVIGESTIV